MKTFIGKFIMWTLGAVIVGAGLVLFLGCSDLSSDPTSTTTVRNWTVPNDNGGHISFYEFKYTADSSIAYGSWTDVDGEPPPEAIGNSQSWDMPLPEGTWFVAMRCSDGQQWSEVSNIVHVLIDNTPPEAVSDLR